MAKPCTYTQEAADEICRRIAEGEPLRQICRDESMPAWPVVYAWIKKYPEFAGDMECARQIGFDAIAEDALIIADTTEEGVRTESGKDGVKEVREDMLGHRKLRIETRLKLLAKWHPQKYGEKIDLNHGGQKDNPVKAVSMTPDEFRKVAEEVAEKF